MISKRELGKFHHCLHGWFRENGRDLPWRRTRDPYAVLVSEFMLQQTTVVAVIPYYRRWMREFPDVFALSRAGEETVLKLWEGLGYYSRARNLLRAAREIVAGHGGVIPGELSGLLRLPGIGPYTASAIAAFAFDRCVPVLDANVIRVVARLGNFRKPVVTAQGKIEVERLARSLLPETGGWLHSSALMELGAVVCRAGVPACEACPVRSFCRADSPGKIPVKPPRKTIIHERDLRIFAKGRGRVFLVPAPGPRWKGLWLLPPGTEEGKILFELSHVVTRHKIRMTVSAGRPRATWKAFAPDDLPPMPTPHRKALEALFGFQKQTVSGPGC